MRFRNESRLDCIDVSKPTHATSAFGHCRSLAFPVLAAGMLWTNAALGAGTELVQMIPVPGAPLASYDISWVDPTRHHYYLSDRSNAGVDIFDTRTNQFVGRVGGFAGFTGDNDTSGPDGLVADGDRAYTRANEPTSSSRLCTTAIDGHECRKRHDRRVDSPGRRLGRGVVQPRR
jgi:hypothetical protein